MLAILVRLVGGWRGFAAALMALAVSAVAAFYYGSYVSAKARAQVAEARAELESVKAEISRKALEAVVRRKKLDDRLVADLEKRIASIEADLDADRKAISTLEDGPLAPVLRGAVERIKGREDKR